MRKPDNMRKLKDWLDIAAPVASLATLAMIAILDVAFPAPALTTYLVAVTVSLVVTFFAGINLVGSGMGPSVDRRRLATKGHNLARWSSFLHGVSIGFAWAVIILL